MKSLHRRARSAVTADWSNQWLLHDVAQQSGSAASRGKSDGKAYGWFAADERTQRIATLDIIRGFALRRARRRTPAGADDLLCDPGALEYLVVEPQRSRADGATLGVDDLWFPRSVQSV
jgi:hypothetical protein